MNPSLLAHMRKCSSTFPERWRDQLAHKYQTGEYTADDCMTVLLWLFDRRRQYRKP